MKQWNWELRKGKKKTPKKTNKQQQTNPKSYIGYKICVFVILKSNSIKQTNQHKDVCPDLNPTENLWGALKRAAHKRCPCNLSWHQKKTVTLSWNSANTKICASPPLNTSWSCYILFYQSGKLIFSQLVMCFESEESKASSSQWW